MNQKCKHEWDGHVLSSYPAAYQCKKCWRVFDNSNMTNNKGSPRELMYRTNEGVSDLCGVPNNESFQRRVGLWLVQCFGHEIANNKIERNHRFFEEATELVQANGMTKNEAYQLVDYVYSRPEGELHQEVGGAMTTLAALCRAINIDMYEAGEKELGRINEPEMTAKIRAKQAAKPKHSPLPQTMPPNAITASVVRDGGGEQPAFCLMVAYRSEKDAMDALAMIAAAPTPAAQADSQPAPQGETNVQLGIDSNLSTPGQHRDMAGSVALGQPMGYGQDQASGHPGAQGDKLLTVAERNIRSFLRSAVFKNESDREAALSCVDVLRDAARKQGGA